MRTIVKMFLAAFVLMPMLDAPCRSQTVANPILKSNDLSADMAILRSAYEQLHPGLYRYNSKAEMDAHFAALKTQLNRDQSLREAFLAFSEFAAEVQCGHTQANPFNQQKPLIEALFKTPTRLPFYFEWLDRRMIVTRDFTPDHALPPGTEVSSIDGVPTATILMRMLSIARADGGNDRKRVVQLAVHGDSQFETFDIYYPMFYPSERSTSALLVRKPNAADDQRVAVKHLTFEERIAPIKVRESQRTGGAKVLFEWKYLAGGIAYLRMPSWALYDSKWNWKNWLNEHLNEAARRKSLGLILDLRGNEGGDDVGKEIIPHLIDSPMAPSSMRRLVRYRKVPEQLVPYLNTWDASFRDWGKSALDLPAPWSTAPKEVRYLDLNPSEQDESGSLIKPSGERFHGKVVVLIDATNSSATFQFAQDVQIHRLAMLVGQPTGGSQRGINGGAFFFLRLPHSGIEMDLPLIGTFPLSPMPDKGLTPDIFVQNDARDIASGRDAELEAAVLAVQK